MWELLRDRQFMSLKFRRQHQIGDYVVDFFCDKHKLVIELDGAVHSEPQQAKKDKTRDAYLRSMGMTVLRLSNKDFMANTERALQQIASACNPPSPFGRGMGGEGSGLRYVDIPGFCRSATLDDIRKHGHVLTPGRYVGAEAAEEDAEPFKEKMKRLTATLREQQAEALKLDVAIAANLKELGYGG
jgi:very-short-patch-repair endonuclease